MTDNTQRARELLAAECRAEKMGPVATAIEQGMHVSGFADIALRAIAAALRLAVPEWRPIETAPKDGLIDIWIKDGFSGTRWCDCYYDEVCREWRTIRPSGKLLTVHERHVSHWMPRPAAPTVSAEGAPDARG